MNTGEEISGVREQVSHKGGVWRDRKEQKWMEQLVVTLEVHTHMERVKIE